MLRRTVFAALGVGFVALVVLSLVGYPLAGLGCLHRARPRDREHPPRDVDGVAAQRLRDDQDQAPHGDEHPYPASRLTTVIAIGLVVVNLPLGMGVLGGVAVFYFLFVVSLVVTLLHQGAVT